ncbi:Adenylosuccinate synthetase [Bienertia sinuspersici]
MEHPHNAVLLICSAYDKGCRPYMCDTSYRHSNCLDQFRKSFAEASTEAAIEEGSQPVVQSSEIVAIETVVTPHEEGKSESSVAAEIASMHKLQQKLVCPLCRGQIIGWVVAESAREYMNAKSRSCASETCEFTGNYTDLRKHARLEHPQARPFEADPERQRNWRRLERQRDIGDVLSTIQSSFGEDQDDNAAVLPMDERGLITIFFLIRVWHPSSSPRSSSWSGNSRARTRAQHSANARRRAATAARLSGEPTEPAFGSIEDEDSSDGGSVNLRRRVRRRLSTPDDEV